jgi:hypothetical protein
VPVSCRFAEVMQAPRATGKVARRSGKIDCLQYVHACIKPDDAQSAAAREHRVDLGQRAKAPARRSSEKKRDSRGSINARASSCQMRSGVATRVRHPRRWRA